MRSMTRGMFKDEAIFKQMREIRCDFCGETLGKGAAVLLEITCPRCGTLKRIRRSLPCLPVLALKGDFPCDED